MTNLPDPDTQPQFYDGVAIKRLMAWIVDSVLILLVSVAILPFTAFTGVFFFSVLMLVVGFAYRTLTLAGGSATWGMRLFAIEFRTLHAERFDFGTALAHTLGYSISLAVFPAQAVSIILMLTTSRGQGLTDHVLGTVAMNRRAVVA